MTASEVEFLHFRIRLDFSRRTFLEDAAVVHHRHALDYATRAVHVVCDDDVADVRREGGEDLDEFGPLGRRKPGGRLVEQYEARRARKRQGDRELTLLAVGEFRRQPGPDRREVNRLDQVFRRLDKRVIAARPDNRIPAARDAATREIDVVEDGNAGEERGNLIGAAQSATDSLVGRKCGHVLAEKSDRSRGWWKVAGDAVEKRRLACAVRSQNAPA